MTVTVPELVAAFDIGAAELDALLNRALEISRQSLSRAHDLAARSAPPAAAPLHTGLANEDAFFDIVRANPPLGPTLSQPEVDGCKRILNACIGQPLAFAANILATDVHETAGQMIPLREYGKGAGRVYGQPGKHGGQIPYGRGDVQLTWDANYERADAELELNGRLLANFDLALDPQISAQIMVRGMTEGWFTSKKLGDYLPSIGAASAEQQAQARRVVNGTDKAQLIAGYAMTFQAALQAGGWT